MPASPTARPSHRAALPLRPYRFGLATVSARFSGQPDWNVLSKIHLTLRCGEACENRLVIHRRSLAAAPGHFRIKTMARAPLRIEYWLVYYFKDGRRHETASYRADDTDLTLRPAP